MAGAAEFLKSENQRGTIAVGPRADVILLNANPLLDVANVNRREGVAHGRSIPKRASRGGWSTLAASYARRKAVQ
jgi:imidazolonepropionase-like amidohydrolase